MRSLKLFGLVVVAASERERLSYERTFMDITKISDFPSWEKGWARFFRNERPRFLRVDDFSSGRTVNPRRPEDSHAFLRDRTAASYYLRYFEYAADSIFTVRVGHFCHCDITDVLSSVAHSFRRYWLSYRPTISPSVLSRGRLVPKIIAPVPGRQSRFKFIIKIIKKHGLWKKYKKKRTNGHCIIFFVFFFIFFYRFASSKVRRPGASAATTPERRALIVLLRHTRRRVRFCSDLPSRVFFIVAPTAFQIPPRPSDFAI